MLRVYTRENDHLTPHDIGVAEEPWPQPPAGTTPWIDLVNPTANEDKYVDHAFAVSIPTREEMQEIELSSRLYHENGAEFMTISAVVQIDTDEPILSPMTFVLKGPTLVTVRYTDPRPFSMFIARAQRPGSVPCANGEQVMFSLLEAIVDRLADALERVGLKIDSISREVFRHSSAKRASSRAADFQKVIVDIGKEGDLLSLMRESLVSINRALTYHNAVSDEGKRALKEARQRMRTVQRDVSSLMDHATYLSNKVNFLLDATLGLINLEQNQIIKIFSIASVCLMPPTLIASLYGMNFRFMPELQLAYGYPMALGAMVVSAILPFVYFKRKGWL